MSSLTHWPEWHALQQHYQVIAPVHLRDLFIDAPDRFHEFSLEFGDLLFDYSKNRIDKTTINLLCQLAKKAQLAEKISALFSGAPINTTEHRPVLHTALRRAGDQPLVVNDIDIMPMVHTVLDQMERLVTEIHRGQLTGYTGESITDIVNIGIGGSNLGPLMVSEALKPYAHNNICLHFLSNIHSGNLKQTIDELDPARTLFIISTKTFSTIETLVNTESLQQWFQQTTYNKADFFKQVIAVTADPQKAIALGVPAAQILEFWEWVGGRYSLWSAIGLPIALAIGMPNFRALLVGAYTMDQHFSSAPFHANMPVLMGLLGIWYNNFFNINSCAIIPYNYYLRHLPAYLQQLDMESNGKQTTIAGKVTDYATGPVIWGGMGTDGQHAFHQLLHQGTQFIPADFIIDIATDPHYQAHQDILFASCLGQTRALMQGINQQEVMTELMAKGYTDQQAETLALHKVHPGNRPSNTLMINGLTPHNLGALIALYEHKVFVQGAIWGINSFDQWGVELGKVITQQLLASLAAKSMDDSYDASTFGLMQRYIA